MGRAKIKLKLPPLKEVGARVDEASASGKKMLGDTALFLAKARDTALDIIVNDGTDPQGRDAAEKILDRINKLPQDSLQVIDEAALLLPRIKF